MASKALIIGALPKPFEGPWIPISEADAWKLVSDEFDGAVVLETCQELTRDGPRGRSVVSNPEEFSGKFARALIQRGIEDVTTVSVEIETL